MAFYFQYRKLRQEVEKQLKDLKDEEKGSPSNASLLSGTTEQPAQKEAGNKAQDESQNASPYAENGLEERSEDSYACLSGITRKTRDNGEHYYLVEWQSADDPEVGPHRSRNYRPALTMPSCLATGTSLPDYSQSWS